MAFRGWDKEELRLPDGRVVNAICPKIISASRATDIPAFFSEWFANRLRAGYVRWTNPFNAKQVQYVSFSRTRVIVFWTKDPNPLLKYLPQINQTGMNYYFQFTVNDYETEGLEPNLAPLSERIKTFKYLSDIIGPKRVIWRFDPLILSNSLTIDELLRRIERIAGLLQGYTKKLVISFVDINVYKKVRNNLNCQSEDYFEFTNEQKVDFAEQLAALNRNWELEFATCAEGIDLEQYGIKHNRCIDDSLMIDQFSDDKTLMNFLGHQAQLLPGLRPNLKDKGQRKECGCIVSKDIGMYNTCGHLCVYCYANASRKAVENNHQKHNTHSEAIVL